MKLSIVVPTINSALFIDEFVHNIIQVTKDFEFSYELLFVNDGSVDQTKVKLNSLKEDHPKFIRIINLENNHGQREATLIGLKHAEGKYCVTFDHDLQHRPEDIPNLLKVLEGSDSWVSCGYYKKERSNSIYVILRTLAIFLLNNIFFPKYKEKKYFTSFKAFNMDALKRENLMNTYHFWEIPPSKINVLYVNKHPRYMGLSSYNLKRAFSFFLPILVKCLIKSYYLITPMVLVSAFLSIKLSFVLTFIALGVLLISLFYLKNNAKAYEEIKFTS